MSNEQSEYGVYLDIKSAMARAKHHGLDIQWTSDGWSVVNGIVMGRTARELHQYLSGLEDGVARERRYRNKIK